MSSTLAREAEDLLGAGCWELQRAAVLAVSHGRPANAASYLRLCAAVYRLDPAAVDLQSLYRLADALERAGDQAARLDWEELDCVDSAVGLLLELADTIERRGL